MNKDNKQRTLLVILFAIGVIAMIIPTSFYIEEPGKAMDVEPMIEIEGLDEEVDGTYMLTTVMLKRATLSGLVSNWFDPFQDAYSSEELLGDIEDYDVYLELQDMMMESSKQTAVEAAYNAADYPVERDYLGVYVVSVVEGSSFAQELQTGDILTKVNGESFENVEEFMDYVNSLEVGDEVTVHYNRAGEEHVAHGALILLEETGMPGIGVSITDYSTIEVDPEVNIDAGQIGGPSAGFMFALHIYSELNDPTLPQGQKIAGTGTINSDGKIGRIGGINKKIVAAEEEGVTVFFAPNDEITPEMREFDPVIKSNYQEAVEAAEMIEADLEVIPVKNLTDAIKYLENQSISEAKGPEFSLAA